MTTYVKCNEMKTSGTENVDHIFVKNQNLFRSLAENKQHRVNDVALPTTIWPDNS